MEKLTRKKSERENATKFIQIISVITFAVVIVTISLAAIRSLDSPIINLIQFSVPSSST